MFSYLFVKGLSALQQAIQKAPFLIFSCQKCLNFCCKMLLTLRIINTFRLALEMQVRLKRWKRMAIRRYQSLCRNSRSLADGGDKNWHPWLGPKIELRRQSGEKFDTDPNFSPRPLPSWGLDSPQGFVVRRVVWTGRG